MDFFHKSRTRAEFEQFVESHIDELLRTGYLLTGSLPEAEDLVQECLLRLARRWPKVRSVDRPGAYARKILVNVALDGAKRRARRWQELGGDGLSEARMALLGEKSALDAPEARLNEDTELFEALRVLPTQQRVILVLRYFGDLSEMQAAETLGVSIGTVKSTTSRALSRLRELLKERSPEDHPHAAEIHGTTTSRSRSK